MISNYHQETQQKDWTEAGSFNSPLLGCLVLIFLTFRNSLHQSYNVANFSIGEALPNGRQKPHSTKICCYAKAKAVTVVVVVKVVYFHCIHTTRNNCS